MKACASPSSYPHACKAAPRPAKLHEDWAGGEREWERERGTELEREAPVAHTVVSGEGMRDPLNTYLRVGG